MFLQSCKCRFLTLPCWPLKKKILCPYLYIACSGWTPTCFSTQSEEQPRKYSNEKRQWLRCDTLCRVLPWSCVSAWVRSAPGERGWYKPWACRASPETQRPTSWGRWSGWWFGCTSGRHREGGRERERETHLSHLDSSEALVCDRPQRNVSDEDGPTRGELAGKCCT